MNERDMELLVALDDLKTQAAAVGLCPQTFCVLRREVMRIMGERDGARAALLEKEYMSGLERGYSVGNSLIWRK